MLFIILDQSGWWPLESYNKHDLEHILGLTEKGRFDVEKILKSKFRDIKKCYLNLTQSEYFIFNFNLKLLP